MIDDIIRMKITAAFDEITMTQELMSNIRKRLQARIEQERKKLEHQKHGSCAEVDD